MIDKLGKEGIYIIHALKGYEFHENRLIEFFKENELNFEFVTDGDPSHFSDELLYKYFTPDIKQHLSVGVNSCTLNHILAYKKMVENNIEIGLILENDPFFTKNFKEKLENMTGEINGLEKGFIVSLENTTLMFPSYWDTKRNKHLYQAKQGRAAGAYLIDLEGAKRIIKDLESNKCHTVIDWWHNRLIDREIVKMYWAFPGLTEQGSHNGLLSSTISSKSKSNARRVKWLLQKFYKMYIRRLFKEPKVININ